MINTPRPTRQAIPHTTREVIRRQHAEHSGLRRCVADTVHEAIPVRPPMRHLDMMETGPVSERDDGPSPEQVLQALESAGHLLEQEVATRLAELGYSVSTSRAFTDLDEGKSRELDVFAHKELYRNDEKRLRVGLTLLVECKNTSSPLAFLTRPVRDSGRPPEEFVITYHSREEREVRGGETYIIRRPMFDELGLRGEYWGTAETVRAVHVSRLDRKGSAWSAVNTGVFDSLTWPMAKALRAFKSPIRNPNRGFDAKRDWSHVALFVPMVVSASRLFVADGTQLHPTIAEVPFVRFQREFKAKSLQGVFGLDFVQRDSLTSFVRDVVDADLPSGVLAKIVVVLGVETMQVGPREAGVAGEHSGRQFDDTRWRALRPRSLDHARRSASLVASAS